MIAKVIEFSVRNRFLVLLGVLAISLWGVWCVFRTPIDAIPDLSENQVIVWADWPGRSPREIEDQITYPLSVNLQGLASVKSIRAVSEFGFSMINIIFDEKIDFYFARQRVLERLSIAGSFLPPGVVPYLAPDATALGQIFWYTVEGDGYSLDELRSIQDWNVRYQLNAVDGVAQVSSVGGFVREYQIDVDPEKLRAYEVSLGEVFMAVTKSNSSVGGKVIHKGGSEYLVRGYGWIKGIEDIEDVVVVERGGIPIRVEELATVQLGPAFRRSVLEKNGSEAVGGVVMTRYGENPLAVTERVKKRIAEIQKGLPEGVRIVPFYDRTGLIHASIGTLTHTLVEEILVASLVVFLVLWHVRSAFVICSTLPLAVLVSFIFMYYLGIPSNIMSLSGIAISIGVLVDAGIVMTENAYHRLHDHFPGVKVTGDTREIVIEACKLVGGPLFFSILIMLLSFAPIFVLGGIEGKMFNPLAYTKAFALSGVAVLAITLVPALIPTFIRGRLKAQEDVWLVRSFVNIYRPMLDFFLRHPDVIVVITGLFLVVALPIFPRQHGFLPKVPWLFFVLGIPFLIGLTALFIARHKLVCFAILILGAMASYRFLSPRGEEFMPPLNELAVMDMPVTTPNANITQSSDDLKERDRVTRSFPEIHQVVGKAGRAETPTDPAPIDMVETVVSFRPEKWWPRRKYEYADTLAEAGRVVAALQERGILRDIPREERGDFVNTVAMEPATRFDRAMRDLSMTRLREFVPEKGKKFAERIVRETLELLATKGKLEDDPDPDDRTRFEEELAKRYAAIFDEWILLPDVARATDELVEFLVEQGSVEKAGDLLALPRTPLSFLSELGRTFTRAEAPTFQTILRDDLEALHDELMTGFVKELDAEIGDVAPGTTVWLLIEEAVAKGREQGPLGREPRDGELQSLREEREREFESVFLWHKKQEDLVKELDSELQVPGWANIWTRPIINRVDMLATGVRTMVGVKVFGTHFEDRTEKRLEGGKEVEVVVEPGIQTIANEIAAILNGIPGADHPIADQIVGENYLEITIDRKRAARYGVNVQDIQDVIEVALGGKEITLTVEGRQRFPVRVRYPRDWRVDEEAVRSILVPAATGEGMGGAAGEAGPATGRGEMVSELGALGRIRQVPLALVADVRIVPGSSMIKSEDGELRAYVQLNVRERDIMSFVEEAQRAVDAKVKLPPGFHVEWSGQYEHQVRAQKTLMLVFPLVLFIIFVILYMTYRDLPDTLMMFLSVPGAIAGGALFQYIWGYHFSVAVWVGYVACFGLATETGIVMLVYLRESIDRRGGMEKIASEAQIKEAVMEGAVQRLRPKLLTEGTTILALIPMLWATGVGAEFMKPMAAPILGGILVADEVIDIMIPVLFYKDRCRRLRKRLETARAPIAIESSTTTTP